MVNYEQWIAAHMPVNPAGQCVEMTRRMAAVFPELRRVRGHYHCPMVGRAIPHWWLVAPDGSIVDPTAEQFVSPGVGDYVEHVGPEPTGQCLNCGALLFNGEGFCNAECAIETVQHLACGGRVIVNGVDVTPE